MGAPSTAALEPLENLMLSMRVPELQQLTFADINAIDTVATLGSLPSWRREQV